MARTKITFRRAAVQDMWADPKVADMLLDLAKVAQERAASLAPIRSGTYRESFGTQVVHASGGRPVGRAYNTAEYATLVELGGLRGDRRKHRCLGKGLDSLRGRLQ